MEQAEADAREDALDPIVDEDCLETGTDEGGALATAKIHAFSTNVKLRFYPEGVDADEVILAFVAACRRYERLFSRTLPHSDIACLNAAHGAPVSIDPETADLLEFSRLYAKASEGLFDVTVAPLLDLWEKAQREGCEPSAAKIKRMRSHVGWNKIERFRAGAPVLGPEDDARGWIARLSDPQAQLDCGGIAKGFVADRLGVLLRRRGIGCFLIDVGGDILAGDCKPDGAKWRVGISGADGETVGFVEVARRAVVTSGIGQRGFSVAGTDYPHIIDPRTGRPTTSTLASVTLVTERAIDAEGYSTGVLLLDGGAVDFVKHTKAIRSALFSDVQGKVFTL